MRLPILAAGLCAAAFAAPAFAQSDPNADIPPIENTVFGGDYVTVGLGAGVAPSYEGSDDYVLFPAPAIVGSVGGINFQSRGPGIAVDLLPDAQDSKFGIVLGPVVRLRFDRARQIKDPVVKRLGKLDTAVEVGGQAGVQYSGLITPFDVLSATVDVRWDVASAHKGMVIQPQIAFVSPVSRAAAVTLSATAEYVDDDYADYYFTVTPGDAAISGLPLYKADKGFKNFGVNALFAYDLDGDLTNGGFGAFALVGYNRLLGDAKRSPFTSVRGSADNFLGAIGIGYTF